MSLLGHDSSLAWIKPSVHQYVTLSLSLWNHFFPQDDYKPLLHSLFNYEAMLELLYLHFSISSLNQGPTPPQASDGIPHSPLSLTHTLSLSLCPSLDLSPHRLVVSSFPFHLPVRDVTSLGFFSIPTSFANDNDEGSQSAEPGGHV
jgi:hypothetical protein